MNFGDAVRGAGRSRSWRDAVDAIRGAMPGRGQASRYLADTYGVDRRTAQKWLKGTQAPNEAGGRRDAVRGDRNAQRARTASAMRGARLVDAGTVEVVSKSSGKSAGRRRLGTLALDATAQAKMREAADAYAAGDEKRAAELANDALMIAYTASKDDRRNADAGIQISQYGPIEIS